MKRRSFFALAACLGSLPFLGFLKPKVVSDSGVFNSDLKFTVLAENTYDYALPPGTLVDVWYDGDGKRYKIVDLPDCPALITLPPQQSYVQPMIDSTGPDQTA